MQTGPTNIKGLESVLKCTYSLSLCVRISIVCIVSMCACICVNIYVHVCMCIMFERLKSNSQLHESAPDSFCILTHSNVNIDRSVVTHFPMAMVHYDVFIVTLIR